MPLTEAQIAHEREPIPYTPVKRLERGPLYVRKLKVPHPIAGYSKAHDEYSVIDLRGYRKGYEPRLEILGVYTPNPNDLFRIGTGRLPPYQPTTTGDKLQAEMERLSFPHAWRILPETTSPFTPEVIAQLPQGKLVQRSYHTPVGIVLDFGIQIGDTVYEPRASAVSPLGISEAQKGWREVPAQDRVNYRGWEKKQGKFGNRARAIADIERRWDEIIAKGKTSQEHEKEQLASYESYMKRRAEAEQQYSLKSSDLIVGMALEEIATGNRYVITEITAEGWVYARPENEPTQSGGSIGKGEVRGYHLAIQKVLPTEEEVAIPKAEAGRAVGPSPSKIESYNTQYSLKQLREMAKSAGLSPSGLKLDLLNRLIQKGVLK